MLKKQNGMTLVSWLAIAAFCGVIGLVVLKIIPTYMNYASVKSIMDGLQQDDRIKGKKTKGIRKLLNASLNVNAMSDIANDKNAFKFAKIDNGYKLILKYEQRENLFANLDYVVVFDHEVDLKVK